MWVCVCTLLLLCGAVTEVVSAAGMSPCTSTPSVNPGPPLPELPQQFSAIVEAKIINKNKTVEVTEYYDFINNQGAIYTTRKDADSVLIYNFKNFESYSIADGECRTEDIREGRGGGAFNFTRTAAGGHVTGISDLLKFGTAYKEQYMGTDVVRGIPVDHWTSCFNIHDPINTQFSLDYYFSQPGYPLVNTTTSVPVRAVLKGEGSNFRSNGTHDYDHIYDFVAFTPGPIRDQRVFEIPRGSSCSHSFVIKERPPTLPDLFSVNVEVINVGQKYRQYYRQVYDFPASLSRMDYTPGSSPLAKPEPFGHVPITVIHDFGTGTQFILDQHHGNCTVSKIKPNGIDVETSKEDSALHIKHGRDLFDLNKVAFFYQGKRVVRDLTVDVWGAINKNWPDKESNMAIELHYLQEDWSDSGSGQLAGLWTQQRDLNDTVVMERMLHFYNLESTEPDLSQFSIRNCYTDPQHILDIAFKIPDVRTPNHHELQVAVRRAVMRATDLTAIRIDNIYIEPMSKSGVTVWLSLLARLDHVGSFGDIPASAISLEEAYIALEKAVDSGKFVIAYNVYGGKQKLLKAEPSSLETVSALMDPQQDKQVQKSSGHSSGSMAALGIFMLIGGLVAGLAISYVIWKKRVDIPYLVQH